MIVDKNVTKRMMKMNEEKFDNLNDLIKEYYKLVENNPVGLPPYAKFDMYTERPKQIKDLVDNLSKDNIEIILELWSHGGNITVDGNEYTKYQDRMLHSASNAARLQTCLCEMSKEKLGQLSEDLKEYIINFNDETNESHDKFFTPRKSEVKAKKCINKDKLFKNAAPAIINEILFWYHYDKDKYPIINSRAKETRTLFKKVFPEDSISSKSIEFINQCIEIIDEPLNLDNFTIMKQLLIDQLFYTVDDMNSFQKVKELYGTDKTNDIYKFYIKLWNTIKEYKKVKKSKDLNVFHNIIYHGAPGTSKTFDVIREVNEILDLYNDAKKEFIQFHGSYTYEDFIGGLKPYGTTNMTLKYTNGIFKQLCKEAAKYEIAYYKKFPDEKLTSLTIKEEDIILEISDNETLTIRKGQPVLSQFPPFFIIIDEINRADLSKVFGELLYAIEDDYRGYTNKFKLSSSNIETKDTAVYWDNINDEAYFFVPVNLYIRGTMNDIDKSVDSIDFAFRRRFKWIEKKYDKTILRKMLKEYYNVTKNTDIEEYIQKCDDLNNEIRQLAFTDDSFLIGHAIFRNIIKYTDNVTNILNAAEKVFDNHIEPIIYNYLKMDYGNESNDIEKFKFKFIK